MRRNVTQRQYTTQRPGQCGQSRVLRVRVTVRVTAFELDADGKIVAPAPPAPD